MLKGKCKRKIQGEMMYKQIIIVRKDLGMSTGKIAAQVSHASMAFLTSQIRKKSVKTSDCIYRANTMEYSTGKLQPMQYRRNDLWKWAKEATDREDRVFYAKPVNSKQTCGKLELCESDYYYKTTIKLDRDLYEQ